MSRPRVDRDNELNLLLRLAQGETKTRIALIQAPSGMGKSELVLEFIARCSHDLPKVVVDFKGGGLNLADVFFHVCDTLGWEKFPHLTQAIRHLAQPVAVNVSGNFLVGQNEISVALSGPDEPTREARRAELTTAFVGDLRALGQVVLIFDVFEKCDTLQSWFTSVFLPAAHRSPHLAVIIAGQSVPESTLMWEHELLALKEIDPEHWQTYAEKIGVKMSADHIRGCCGIVKGHCSTVALYIEGLRGTA